MDLPILMYHKIEVQPETQNDLSVSLKAFTAQLAYLQAKEYRSLSLVQLVQAIQKKNLLPPRSCIITFDDAYTSVLELAKPLLDQYGFKATVFVVAAAVGKFNFWDTGKGMTLVNCLNREALHLLAQAGWEIGSHGLRHENLIHLSALALEQELHESKFQLEQLLAQPVPVFCYPYGAWDARSRAAVQQAGYVAACAISPGTASVTADPWALRRVYVKRSDSLSAFQRKISPWYLKYRAWRKR